jgi:hypothetical protein
MGGILEKRRLKSCVLWLRHFMAGVGPIDQALLRAGCSKMTTCPLSPTPLPQGARDFNQACCRLRRITTGAPPNCFFTIHCANALSM